MLNLRKTADEINRLRNQVANQKDTIEKAMKVIEHQINENIKLQDENKKLKDENKKLNELRIKFNEEQRKLFAGDYDACRDLIKHWQTHACPASDIIFPNTDERGLGEGDTPNDLSPLEL